jgi:hypothetical protein
MDCKSMLKDAFAHAQKGRVIARSHDFPNYYAVYATVTLHESADAADKTHDTVWYANGPLEFSREGNVEQLKGTLRAWINSLQMVDVQPPKGNPLSLQSLDIFPYNENLTLDVSIKPGGLVTVQRLLNGRYFLGRKAKEFQPNCTNGLLTSVVDSTSCTLSLTLGVRSSRS